MKEIQDTGQLNAYMDIHGLGDIFTEELMQHLTLYAFDRGELICSQGQPSDRLFILVKGKIKVYTTSAEGKSLILNFFSPVEVIGDIEYVQNINIINTVEAVSPVHMIGVPYRVLHRYAEHSPALLNFLLRIITRKFHQKSNFLRFSLMYPVEVRLASYLQSISYDDSDSGFEGQVSTLDLNDIANLIGTSYRHLNRIIRKLSEEGVIERSKGFIRVKDKKKLSELVDSNIYE